MFPSDETAEDKENEYNLFSGPIISSNGPNRSALQPICPNFLKRSNSNKIVRFTIKPSLGKSESGIQPISKFVNQAPEEPIVVNTISDDFFEIGLMNHGELEALFLDSILKEETQNHSIITKTPPSYLHIPKPILADHFMGRIIWSTLVNKTTTTIKPAPSGISKQKRLRIEPIYFSSMETFKLHFSIEVRDSRKLLLDEIESQLHFDNTVGSSLELSFSFPKSEDEVYFAQEVVLNCTYKKPQSMNKRVSHCVRMRDGDGFEILDWTLEVYNPKWETMSQNGPVEGNFYSLFWFSQGRWMTSVEEHKIELLE